MNEVVSVDMDGFFEVRDPRTGIIETKTKWDLSNDNLNEQSSETIKFLHEILCQSSQLTP